MTRQTSARARATKITQLPSIAARDRQPIRPITLLDLIPMQIHSGTPARGPSDPRTARDRLGALMFSPGFLRYMNTSLLAAGTLDDRDNVDPTQWWRSSYLVGRLEAHFDPLLVQACGQLRALRAAVIKWEDEEWDGKDERALARFHERLEREQSRLAAQFRNHTGHTGRPRQREWLEVQERALVRFVEHAYTRTPRQQRREQYRLRQAA
jgi:hypothetical protein